MSTRLLVALTVFLTAAACGAKPPADLDLTPYRNHVCDLLRLDQLGGFHITQPGTPRDDPSRPSCLWHSGDTRILLTLDFDPYLSATPNTQEAGTVNGFPASHSAIPGKGSQLACATTIDTFRRPTFTATVYTPENACAASDTIASLVIDTIRAGRPAPMSSSLPPPDLDLAPYENRVCDLFTPDQLAPFAIRGPGKSEDTDIGPRCLWDPVLETPGARVGVAIASKRHNGLDDVRARKDSFGFFEEVGTLNGYPAVHFDALGDGHKGSCYTDIGVRTDLFVEVYVFWDGVDSPEYRKPCTLSDKLATQLIDNVRAGR